MLPFRLNLATWCATNDFNVGLLHADPTNPSTQTILSGLAENIPVSFLVGGLSSSHRQNIQIANQALKRWYQWRCVFAGGTDYDQPHPGLYAD